MYYLRYRIVPTASNPECEQLGEAWVGCWIVKRSLAQADKSARQDIRRQKWKVLERECGHVIRPSCYRRRDDGLQYYLQARIDKEVFVYYLSPRHPVFWVSASATDGAATEIAEAHYFLSGASILRDGDDLFDPRFWTRKLVATAVKAARAAIREQGWKVKTFLRKRPCGRNDVPADLVPFYDEAEDRGACLVFVREPYA